MKLKGDDIVTLKGDAAFIGVVQGAAKDDCGQIPVFWFTWDGQREQGQVWVEPYKLERFKVPPK